MPRKNERKQQPPPVVQGVDRSLVESTGSGDLLAHLPESLPAPGVVAPAAPPGAAREAGPLNPDAQPTSLGRLDRSTVESVGGSDAIAQLGLAGAPATFDPTAPLPRAPRQPVESVINDLGTRPGRPLQPSSPIWLVVGGILVLLALVGGAVLLLGIGRQPAPVASKPTAAPTSATHPTTTTVPAQPSNPPTSAPRPAPVPTPIFLVSTSIDPVGGCQLNHITFNWKPGLPLDPSYVGQSFTIDAVGNEIAGTYTKPLTATGVSFDWTAHTPAGGGTWTGEIKKVGDGLPFDTTVKAQVDSTACS